MGIQDRDYMRRHHAPDPRHWDSRRRDTVLREVMHFILGWRGLLLVMALIFCVAGTGIWWSRNTLNNEDGNYLYLAEGSLRVNINNATQSELESVPGIGPTRAAQIIAGRPYKTVEEISRINGISADQVQDMTPFLKVTGSTEKYRGSGGSLAPKAK